MGHEKFFVIENNLKHQLEKIEKHLTAEDCNKLHWFTGSALEEAYKAGIEEDMDLKEIKRDNRLTRFVTFGVYAVLMVMQFMVLWRLNYG